MNKAQKNSQRGWSFWITFVCCSIIGLSIFSLSGCGEPGGTYTLGSQMPGAECFATLLPDGSGGELLIFLPEKDDTELWGIATPTQVPGGAKIGLVPDSGITIDGHLEPVTCPETMAEEGVDICLEVLCPLCRDPDGCPIQKRDD